MELRWLLEHVCGMIVCCVSRPILEHIRKNEYKKFLRDDFHKLRKNADEIEDPDDFGEM